MTEWAKLVAESCGSYPNGREFVHVYLEYPDGTIESLGLRRALCVEREELAVRQHSAAARLRPGAGLNARTRKAA